MKPTLSSTVVSSYFPVAVATLSRIELGPVNAGEYVQLKSHVSVRSSRSFPSSPLT